MMSQDEFQRTANCMRAFYANGVPFENSYMVIDIEATGIRDNTLHLPVQLGHLIYENGNTIVPANATMLNWTTCADVDQDWLERASQYDSENNLRPRMYPFGYNTLRTRGEHYLSVLTKYHTIICDWQDAGGYFLFFNSVGFDRKFLQDIFKRFLDVDFRFNPERTLDSGLNEKGIQLYPVVVPNANETLENFHSRLYNYPNRKRWNLGKFCFEKYDLYDNYALKPEEMHFADKDCLAAHYIYQIQRSFALGIRRECDITSESTLALQAQ